MVLTWQLPTGPRRKPTRGREQIFSYEGEDITAAEIAKRYDRGIEWTRKKLASYGVEQTICIAKTAPRRGRRT